MWSINIGRTCADSFRLTALSIKKWHPYMDEDKIHKLKWEFPAISIARTSELSRGFPCPKTTDQDQKSDTVDKSQGQTKCTVLPLGALYPEATHPLPCRWGHEPSAKYICCMWYKAKVGPHTTQLHKDHFHSLTWQFFIITPFCDNYYTVDSTPWPVCMECPLDLIMISCSSPSDLFGMTRWSLLWLGHF